MGSINRRQLLASSGAAALAQRLSAATLAQVRLGVTTDEIDDDLLTAIKFLRSFGLKYAEIRNIWGKYNTEQPLDKIREARALLDEHGIQTSVLGTGFFKIPLPADTPQGRAVLDNQWSLLDGAIERARILGAGKIRVFAFTYQGEHKEAGEKEYARIYELLREATRRARAKKVRLALENVGGSYVWSGAESARLLKAVSDDALGLAWDPNNAASAGEKPFPDGYRLIDPARIIHVHLRDFRRKDGKVEWCAVGDGEFDNAGQIRALLKAGYKEYFTLETHYRSPQGKAHASKTSLTALLKVIEQV